MALQEYVRHVAMVTSNQTVFQSKMLAVRKTIHLKNDVSVGPGNLSVYTTNEE